MHKPSWMYPWLDHCHTANKTHRYYLFWLQKKTFDYVSHPRLLQKSSHKIFPTIYSIGSQVFFYIRIQHVHIDGILLELKYATNWVPQGSVLGPTLFLIFINDITNINTIPNVTMKLFADKLYACSDSKHNLQRAIDKIIDWSDTWQLRLDSEKCCVCHVYRHSASSI